MGGVKKKTGVLDRGDSACSVVGRSARLSAPPVPAAEGATEPAAGRGEGATSADPLSVNALLHAELASLRAEKASLAAALSAVRAELAESERRAALLPAAGGSDAAAARIMELSRRQRHLTAELEAERGRGRRLRARLEEAERREPPEPAAAPEPEPGAEPEQETAAQLRERLRETTRRLVEARNQAQAARTELRQAERLLQQEVGDGVTVQSLLASGGGWRGRAQQIVALRAQLQAARGESEERLSAADSRARAHLRGLSGQQQAAARQAAEQAAEQAEQTEQLRRRLDAARSRSAVLAQEAAQLRERAARLAEKSGHDDEMIALLEGQLRGLEARLADADRAAVRPPPPAPVSGEQVSLLRAQLTARDAELAGLAAQLAAREREVADLQRQLAERPAAPAPAAAQQSAEESDSDSDSEEDVGELRRRCLRAEFSLDSAEAECRRLAESERSLQERLAELSERTDRAETQLEAERRLAAAARREADGLKQMLGRGRRPAPCPAE